MSDADKGDAPAQVSDPEAADLPADVMITSVQHAAPDQPLDALPMQIEAFDLADDVLVVEYEDGEAPAVAAQQVTEDGLQVTLSDGTIVLLVGLTARLSAERINFVRTATPDPRAA